ncbi:mechanosensitive ion channel domain-containing protein [Gryllotalpicola sp.]|uniref:mechanosensitive ion channel family protein n=1 Tax=Gryllotalpicola sp. TaxID=1932787 RepID=UPI00344009DB
MTAQSAGGGGFWVGLGAFFGTYAGRLVIAALIVLGAVILAGLLRALIRVTVRRIVLRVKKAQNIEDTQLLQASPVAQARVVQRTRTLGSVLTNIANVTITVVAALLIINVLAPEALASLTLLTAAVGAGLGFGAQNIVKDVLNGIILVIEDQLGVGDVVDTGFATGIVESVGIRTTQVRDVAGVLWYVRNGEILRVGNMSQGWARVIVDVGIPWSSDVDAVKSALLDAAAALAKEPRWRTMVVEKPEIWGIESLSADVLVLRVVVKTRTNARDDVARELRARVKAALDGMGVALPSAGAVVLTLNEPAPAVRAPRTRTTTGHVPAQTPKTPGGEK